MTIGSEETSRLATMNIQFTSGDDPSDFTIICADGTELEVHSKGVSKCQFFHGVINRGFKESEEKKVTMADDPPHAVVVSVRCFYDKESYMFDSYNDRGILETIEVYAITEKYDIRSIKSQAGHIISVLLRDVRGNADLFSQIVVAAYTATVDTDRDLRNVVRDHARAHKAALTTGEGAQVMKELMVECPDFAFDLAFFDPLASPSMTPHIEIPAGWFNSQGKHLGSSMPSGVCPCPSSAQYHAQHKPHHDPRTSYHQLVPPTPFGPPAQNYSWSSKNAPCRGFGSSTAHPTPTASNPSNT